MGTEQNKTLINQRVTKAQGITNPLSKRLYTLKEASIYLGRTLWGVREMVWSGQIPIVRHANSRRMFIDINDLEMYVTRNKTTFV
jgi:hypothetical protein